MRHQADIEMTLPVPVNGTTLKVDGIFDVSAALRLKDAIAQLPEAEPVILDFTRARECHDFALAALIHALATMGRLEVATRGLSEHQHRLLKYLGHGPS